MLNAGLAAAQSRVQMALPAGYLQHTVTTAPIATDSRVVLKTERRPGFVRVLSGSDRDIFLRAFQATERDDWTNARSLAAQGRDAMARRLIEWRYLSDKDSGATFEEIATFLRGNPEWPARDALYMRAEAAMRPDVAPQTVLAFFQAQPPVSAIGKIRLGEAFLATGSAANGAALIREGWIGGDFDSVQQSEIVTRHSNLFTADVERARLNRLLLQDQLTAAKQELPRAPSDAQKIAQVRLALAASPTQSMRLLAALPVTLQADPGLLFDRAKLLRQQNQVVSLPSYFGRTRDLAKIDAGKVWEQVGSAARLAIQDRYFTTAHSILRYSGLTNGPEYGEAEFLAGWLDLRFIHNPQEARTHFLNLSRTKARPVSKARAFYWAGRAGEAAGDYTQARQDYAAAGQFPQTLYGQLALAKLGVSTLHIPATASGATPAEAAAYNSRPLTQAMHVLADLGLVAYLRVFATYDAETHPEAKHLVLLASDLSSMGFTDVAVRVAKNGAYNGVHLLTYSHPLLQVPPYSGPGYAPDAAFVLAIIRQETEFDPAAVSAAGARGLMQLMPDSAKRDAARGGASYQPGLLLSSPAYNMRLGMIELAEDLASYGGSYILTAAAYNAGRGNVNKWISLYGDPRSPVVDPLDWIEEIPFAETRNYVQRVLENTEVYRNRLSRRDEPLRILNDLYRPRAPDVQPLPSLRSDAGVPAGR